MGLGEGFVLQARLEHLSSPEMQLTGAVLQVWPNQTDGRENPAKAEVKPSLPPIHLYKLEMALHHNVSILCFRICTT